MDFYSIQTAKLAMPEIPEFSLMRYIRDGYFAEPYKQLIVGSNEALSYADAFHRARAYAWHLSNECGIGPDSTVMFSSRNYVDYLVVVAAVQQTRARLVLATGAATDLEIVASAEATRPDIAIVNQPSHVDALRQAFGSLRVETIRCEHESVAQIEQVIGHGLRHGQDELSSCSGDSQVVLFSSGSTGKPKAIVNRVSSFVHNGTIMARTFEVAPADTCYLPMPFSHTYGLAAIYAAVIAGGTIATLVKYRPESSLSSIVSSNAAVYFGVPTMFQRELRVNSGNEWDLSCLRCGMVAGASIPEASQREFEERFGCKLIQSYGMTETSATLTMSRFSYPLAKRCKTIGKPVEGAQMKLAPGTGEILVKASTMMDGILREDGSLELDLDEDGWLHSGDVGSIDDEGDYYITGRIKDMIIRGGINIFPAEVENVYQNNPDISESCLVGYPDPELGERSCLCVIMREGAQASASDLRLYASGLVEKCKIPDTVMKVGDLPRLGNGKIDKNTLRKRVVEAFAATRRGRS